MSAKRPHEHGQPSQTCQHPACVAAFRRYIKQWNYERSQGRTRIIPAQPVIHHVATLRGFGWSQRAIAAEADLSPTTHSRIFRDQKGVHRDVAAKVLAIDPRTIPTRGSKPDSEPFVPRTGTVRRIQALMAIGYSHSHLSAHGIHSRCLIHQQGQWVTRTTHDRVAAVYRDLANHPGPSERARREAAKRGYLSPAAWDNIDRDPEPDLGDTQPRRSDVDEVVVLRILNGDSTPASAATVAERRAVVSAWRDSGRPINDLARLTGWKPERYTTQEGDAA